jgi:hypothetical protein
LTSPFCDSLDAVPLNETASNSTAGADPTNPIDAKVGA